MSTKEQLLHYLQQHDTYVSGQDIADTLSVSRNAIWKAIDTLRKEGYVISSVTNKGYKLEKRPHELNATYLQSQFPQADIFVYDSIDSTNTQAKLFSDKLTKDFAVFISKEQTHGRGRFNRQFYSPKGTGIYTSVLLPAQHLVAHLSVITPLVAVALLKAIKKELGIIVSIKWVNDLFYRQKKVVGILTEAMTNIELNTINHLVIGFGINLYEDPHLPEELQAIVGHLSDSPVDINALLISILSELFHLLEQLPDTSFIQTYKQHCFLINQQVTVHPIGVPSYPAIAKDITQTGELVVQCQDGTIQTLHYGEVSVRQ